MPFGSRAPDGASNRPRVDSVESCIGSCIRARRFELGFSAPDLATRLGMELARLAAVEQGEIRPTAAELYDTALALGLTIHDLLDDAIGTLFPPPRTAPG